MVKGLEEPCPDSDPVFDGVHEWMTQKALRRRSRVIPGERLSLVDRIVRDCCFPPKAVWNAVVALEDQGWVEASGDGFRVVEFWEQSDENFFEKLYANPHAAGPVGGKLSLAKATACRAQENETSAASRVPPVYPPSEARPQGVKGESAQIYGPAPNYRHSKRVKLARIFFPDLCRQHGIVFLPGQFDWRPLAGALRRWEENEGIDTDMARQLMEEFVCHPEWCQNKTFPWRVFLARRNKLLDLVTTRQRRDPGNRRHSGGVEYWLAR